jgi:hypothetical protein
VSFDLATESPELARVETRLRRLHDMPEYPGSHGRHNQYAETWVWFLYVRTLLMLEEDRHPARLWYQSLGLRKTI